MIELFIHFLREPLPNDLKKEINKSFMNKKDKDLVETILSARKKSYPFPIEHPYASLLGGLPNKTKKVLLDKNPKLISTIAKILFAMGFSDVIKGMERPPDINRQMGPVFKQWLKKHFSNKNEYCFTTDLLNQPKGKVAFFDGGDKAIDSYVRTVLKVGFPELSLRRDVLVNVDGLIIVGEARFLSTSGGSQTRDIGNTLEFVRTINMSNIQNLLAIAIIYGIVWFDTSYRKLIGGEHDSVPVMSALLLEDYIKEVKS